MKSLKKIIKLLSRQKKTEIEKPFFTNDILKNDSFQIGDYTYGVPKVLFSDSGALLNIGKFCSIADNVTIFLGGNHRHDWITTYPFNKIDHFNDVAQHIKGHPSTNGDVIIGHDVWIGRGSTIMSGITIGNGAVIAANSLVSKNVGEYEIWGGNPAKLIKRRFDNNTIEQLLQNPWWDWEIEKVKARIDNLMSTPNSSKPYDK